MKLKEYIKEALTLLTNAGVEEPALDARLLAQKAFQYDTTAFLCQMEEEQDNAEGIALFQNLVLKRAQKVPVAYLIGHRAFWEQDYLVNENVLIPRPDTEILLEEALSSTEELMGAGKERPRVLDLCTGSGCIAVSYSVETSLCVTASDISQEALTVASENATRNGATVLFRKSDLFEAFGANEIFDLITCNPPYIAHSEYAKLSDEVHHEPIEALDDGGDGLSFYRSLAEEAPKHLSQGGILLLEIGYNQAKAITDIFRRIPWRFAILKKDLAGNDRVLKFIKI